MSKIPNYVFDADDELCHWGIKGQRWGFRRFQNEDGSLTPEGRERYGEGGAKSKSDVQKYKAKVSFKTQQYKADLKSKAQIEKDKRAAKEERNRLKEQAKTEKAQKKEQGKIDRAAKKEQAKTEKQGRPLGMKITRTKNMSDEDLQKAVERLKLQAEYNKQYVLATQPNGALAKADRFFEGPTGKAVLDLSKAVLPAVATAATNKILDSSLKYHNKLDREKAEAEIEKNKASAERERALARSNDATAAKTKSETESSRLDSELKRKIDTSNQLSALWEKKREVERLDKQAENKMKIERSEQAIKAAKARLDMKVESIKQFGGLEYTDSKGAKYKTSGLIVEDDLQKQLETIKKRKDMGFW